MFLINVNKLKNMTAEIFKRVVLIKIIVFAHYRTEDQRMITMIVEGKSEMFNDNLERKNRRQFSNGRRPKL